MQYLHCCCHGSQEGDELPWLDSDAKDAMCLVTFISYLGAVKGTDILSNTIICSFVKTVQFRWHFKYRMHRFVS